MPRNAMCRCRCCYHPQSSVVKEACATVSSLARSLGRDLGPIAPGLVGALSKQLPSAKQVMSESAHRAACDIMRKCQCAFELGTVLGGDGMMGSRSGA